MTDLLLNGGEMSDGQTEHTHIPPASILQQSQPSTTTSTAGVGGNNTFNIHTIIPPTSNSDGTMGKVTNLSMQVPQSAPISQGTTLSYHRLQLYSS